MAEPSDIEETRTVEFGLSVTYQLNENPGKLRQYVGDSKAITDKSYQIEDRFDDLNAEEKSGRNEDTNNTDLSATRRWIHKPKSQDLAPLLDRDDMRTTRLDLKSPAAMQVAKALRRAQGIRWLQGFYGNAYTGEQGLTAVPFKPANILPVDADEASPAGITLNKLIAMGELIRETLAVDDEDPEPIYAGITAKQITNLLKINEMRSRDYNPNLPAMLQTGKPAPFMGFTWVPTQLGDNRVYPGATSLTVDGSGYRRVPIWVNSGIFWGNWEEQFVRVSERNDKKHSWQIYAETCGAATRTHEDKCFQMLCLET
jgi:hypothetical protein